MGVAIVSPGVLGPWYAKKVPAVPDALEGWFEFDTALERIGYNKAPDKSNARLVGRPTVFAGYARFKGGSNFLETQIRETAAFTILAVCRVPGPLGGTTSPTAAPYVSTSSGVPLNPAFAGGMSMHHITDTTLTGSANRMNAAGDAFTTAQANMTDVPTNWGLRVLRVSVAGGTRISNLTTGVSSNQSLATQRLLTTSMLRIGSTYGTTFLGETDISQMVIYSADKTDAEIDQIAVDMRKRAARLGISV